jgi:hypothetical protein
VRVQHELFRAVDLPAGRHRVVWTFAPRSVERGLWISLATLVVALGFIAVARVRSRRRA